ncbi:hypothetical protein LCGC14_1933330, partial [marine sediment metagenome]
RGRRAWYNPPCCPSNVVRFLPEIGTTIYGKTDNAIYVNQFIGSSTSISLADNDISLVLETAYPWKGGINLKIDRSDCSINNLLLAVLRLNNAAHSITSPP